MRISDWSSDVCSSDLDTRAYAMFGDVIWHATDRLNLTFGLRWTRDEKDFTWLNNPRSAPTLDATLAQLDAIGLFAALNQMGLPVTPDTLMFETGRASGRERVWQDGESRVVAVSLKKKIHNSI